MDIERYLQIIDIDLKDNLLPELLGRVFHVTTKLSWQKIKADSCLKPNIDGRFGLNFGQTKPSFFCKRGCISLFDLRNIDTNQIECALMKLNFLNPNFSNSSETEKNKAVYLFFNEVISDHLIPWTQWREEKCYNEMVIPHVEAGYYGEIPLVNIVSILHTDVIIDKPNFCPAWADAMINRNVSK